MRQVFIFLSVGTLLLLFSCTENPEVKTETAAIPVKLDSVKVKKIQVPIRTSGILAPVSQMKLSFKTGGIIAKIFVDEGERVKQGQLLAQLNLREIEARMSQAESAFEKARRDFERVEKLSTDSVATIEQFQNARTGLEIARADWQVAKFNWEHSSVKAPLAGSILSRLAEENEMAAPGQPIFIFGVSGQEWLVRVGVTERDLLKITRNDSARVTFDAYPDLVFLAQVSEIAEAAQPLNGMFEVELIIRKNQLPLKAGFIAKVEIIPSQTEEHYVIPIEALIEADEEGAYVYTPSVALDSVKKLPVQIAFVFGEEVAIRHGLENTAQVITIGAPYLSDDSKILVKK